MPDTPEIDGQDLAEVYDEDNQSPDSERIAGRDGLTFEEMPSLFDATHAVGDDDDDDALIGDDLDDSEIVELALDDDEDDDDLEDDDLRTRSADAFDDEDGEELDFSEDVDKRDGVASLSPDEIDLEYSGDLTDIKGAHSGAQRYESSRLSDEDIDKLGYGTGERAADRDAEAEAKSFDPADRTPEEHARHAKQDELLDEGVEETFPASDPVSVKHIT